MCFWLWFKSPEEQEALQRTAELDKIIICDKKAQEKTVKLLLLGSGESGKSTFIKQLRIIQGDGFSQAYRDECIPVIRSNLMQAIKSIMSAMATLYIEFATPAGKEASIQVLKTLNQVEQEATSDPEEIIDIEPDQLNSICKSIKTLWEDSGFIACYERNREYQLIDSAKYYLDRAESICHPAFNPEDQDILRSRKRTTQIIEYVYDIKKVQLKVIDVGGQRKERRKWLQCFDNVTCLIFLCALSDYDLRLQENNETNRMVESLELFGTILNYPWFQKKSHILFLNKMDLFEIKLPKSRLADYFPEYKGGDSDVGAARDFIRSMYEERKPEEPSNRDPIDCIHIFPHYTCATDTGNMSKVFKDVQEVILRSYLNEFNLV